jgi:hypothetical protein
MLRACARGGEGQSQGGNAAKHGGQWLHRDGEANYGNRSHGVPGEDRFSGRK